MAWLFLAAALVVGAAGAGTGNKRHLVVKVDGGDTIELNLDDLADGETRTFDQRGKTIEVTRNGDEMFVTVDGKRLDGVGTKKVVLHTTETSEGDAATEKRIVVWHAGEGDAAEIVAYRCPEDGTQVLVRRENASDSMQCPLDGRPLEKLKAGDGFAFSFGDPKGGSTSE
jgi:hypothetical protein